MNGEKRVTLDVRPVPPKDRFETIMGAYDALEPGQVLDLTVDHDPECMYYTLKATQGDEAFTFEYLEKGPIDWRVEVRKTTKEATMKAELPIPATMTVNEAIRRFPATVAVFNEYGIDACCGGAVPIDEAARRDGADPEALLAALQRAAEGTAT